MRRRSPFVQEPRRLAGSCAWVNGVDEDRTHNLLNAIQALSQLSYHPKWEAKYSRTQRLLDTL